MGSALAVAAGGAFGSVMRYVATRLAVEWGSSSTWGTFWVNVTGSLILGLIVGLSDQRIVLSPAVRSGLTVGVMGGYTTFSTLMLDGTRQLGAGSMLAAAANIGGSVAVGLAAMAFGLWLGRSS
ncbi:MAG: CrcB family protein [Dehalococcoidia bacterium]|nr:CrcB family protein [Dehalococcoidia bacterium]